jgi:inosose dehydratase
MSPRDRRAFLCRAAGTVAGCLLLDAVAQSEEKPPRPIPFAFSLYGMKTLTLAEGLEACAKIGYDAVELPVMPDWPADPKRLDRDARRKLRERLEALKLSLPSLMHNLPLDTDEKTHRSQIDQLKAAAELGHELSSTSPPLIETVLGGKPDKWESLKDQFLARLGDWAKVAEQTRTVIAVKPHRFGAMNTPEQALWLVGKLNSEWIKLAYDYSHFEHRDMSLADTLKAMLPHTCFIHIKDTKLDKGQVQFVLPGEGTTDYVSLLKQVRASGYSGCVCVEVSAGIHNQKGYDPLAAARRCYESIAPAFEKAGVRCKRAG